MKSAQDSPGLLEKLTTLLFFLGILLSVTHQLWAYDVWWHLKTGEWIFTHLAVPRTDLFSYTVPDHAWIDLSWGFQLLIYIFYKALGINGIIFFKAFVVTLTFFLLFRFFYRKIDLFLLLPILALTLFTAHERLVERPEVLSYLFLVTYLLILERDRQKPSKWLYALPFLQILWVNTHALFILGLFALGVFWLGEIFPWLSSRLPYAKQASPPVFPKRLTAVFFLACCATLANPYGLKGAMFPLTLFTRISGEIDIFTLGIGEFKRPLSAYDPSLTITLYKILLVVAPLSFFVNRKRFPFSHGILFILFMFLSLLARRNIAPFSLISCFLILSNLEGLSYERPPFLERLAFSTLLKKIKPAKECALFFFVLLLPFPFITNAFYDHEGLHKRFGLGISENRYCIRAANFIEKVDMHGNFFNSGLEVGNYFIWHFYPERKVFMDGRLEVYGESFFKELFQLFNAPSLWPKWVERYQINFSIFDHTSEKHENLLRWISRRADWSPIYLDAQAVIFIKKAPENHELLKVFTIDLVNDPPPSSSGDEISELRLADFYGKIGIFDKAETLYRKHLSPLRQNAAIYHNLGHIFYQQGRTEEALSAYQQAITLNPKYYLFHYSLGTFYLELGKEDLALQEFKKSLALFPDFGEAHYQLGGLYVKRGDFEKAEKEYRRVRVSDSASLSARNALGILYAEKEEYEKAEREFGEILKVDPDAAGTLENLKRLKNLMGKQ